VDELSSNRSKEQRCVATVAFAPHIEETTAEPSLVGEVVGHCAGDCRLARTSHAIQPEYTFAVWIAVPIVYLVKKVNSGVWMASRVVFVGVAVERGAFGGAEFGKNDLLMDVN
jgi:hypothetical protein